MNIEAKRYALNDIDKYVFALHCYLIAQANNPIVFFEKVKEKILSYGLSHSYLEDIIPIELKKAWKKTYYAKFNEVSFNEVSFNQLKKDFNLENVKSFFDVFAGTASVAKAGFPYFDRIIINDILHANNLIYKAFFEISKWNIEKVEGILLEYNNLNINDLEDNYFSINFGNKFFDYQNAKLIGYIREDLEHRKKELTEKEFCVLLASLIYNIDKIANTVGHFDAYIKKPIKQTTLQLGLIQPTEFAGIEIYQENANALARRIKADIAYIDPPYNSRQYSRFYHIYDNLVTWKKPALSGVALKPKLENMSVYCTVGAKNAFRDLVENLDVNYLAVSYNNTYNAKSSSSENKIPLEQMQAILEQRGETKVFESAHRFFNTGKTEFDDHKELLFVTKIRK